MPIVQYMEKKMKHVKRTPKKYLIKQLVKASRHIDSGPDIFKSYEQVR